jgi:2'-5' RNA ligase
MVSDVDGELGRIPAEQRLNVFALVIYIPDPLGRFLDELRRELVPHYNPHAHVSVLPPRPLAVTWQTASAEAAALTSDWVPFEVDLTEVSVFPVTGVIYLEVGRGSDELRRMHAAMNKTSLAFQEPFVYHPHVTLAQELPLDQVSATCDTASRRWREYAESRSFTAAQAVLVQNTLTNHWIDLAEYDLGTAPKPWLHR